MLLRNGSDGGAAACCGTELPCDPCPRFPAGEFVVFVTGTSTPDLITESIAWFMNSISIKQLQTLFIESCAVDFIRIQSNGHKKCYLSAHKTIDWFLRHKLFHVTHASLLAAAQNRRLCFICKLQLMITVEISNNLPKSRVKVFASFSNGLRFVRALCSFHTSVRAVGVIWCSWWCTAKRMRAKCVRIAQPGLMVNSSFSFASEGLHNKSNIGAFAQWGGPATSRPDWRLCEQKPFGCDPSTQRYSLSFAGLANSSNSVKSPSLGGVTIKSPLGSGGLRLGLSKKIRVKPLHSSVKIIQSWNEKMYCQIGTQKSDCTAKNWTHDEDPVEFRRHSHPFVVLCMLDWDVAEWSFSFRFNVSRWWRSREASRQTVRCVLHMLCSSGVQTVMPRWRMFVFQDFGKLGSRDRKFFQLDASIPCVVTFPVLKFLEIRVCA